MLKIPSTENPRTDKTFVVDDRRVEIPKWIGNLASFRLKQANDESEVPEFTLETR